MKTGVCFERADIYLPNGFVNRYSSREGPASHVKCNQIYMHGKSTLEIVRDGGDIELYVNMPFHVYF